jgi:hypothetical protein
MLKRVAGLVRRVELLLVVACAWALAMGMPREARADGGGCTDTCTAAFGSSYVANGRLYLLADCAVSDSGTTFCMYIGKALLPSIG